MIPLHLMCTQPPKLQGALQEKAIVDVFSYVQAHYDVPDWDQEAGVEDTGAYRAEQFNAR